MRTRLKIGKTVWQTCRISSFCYQHDKESSFLTIRQAQHPHPPASGASKALLVVRIAKSRYHLTLYVVTTNSTFGTKLVLIVCRAVIVAILTEEATLRQRILAHCNDKLLSLICILI
jgi:hypothetical protein